MFHLILGFYIGGIHRGLGNSEPEGTNALRGD